ncbi:MAG: PBP1A family penicillin-binding protein [Thermodesulfobacteriota bacterium]
MKYLLNGIFFLFFILVVTCAYADEPSYPADAIWTRPGAHFSSVKIYDARERLITRLLPDHKEMVKIDQIPRDLQNALVAVEDHRFYSHHGVDVLGVGRALVKNIIKGRVVEGGSTITQQLVKNMLLSNEKTMSRKLREGMLALEFEQKYSKKQILEMYFNYVYFGNGAWGVQQAARLYFDKNVSDLSLAECVVLAGIPKSPNNFNPFAGKVRSKERRNLVLAKMVEHGFLDKKRASRALKFPLSTARKPGKSYFSEYIRQKLIDRFGEGVIRAGGYKIYTTLDLDLQRSAEQVLVDGLKRVEGKGSRAAGLQGAFLAIDPRNGHIKAVVGGRDFHTSPYNRAFYARRQPGSSFKPFIYAAALEKGFPVSSIWSDESLSYDIGNGKVWKPSNYDNKYFGHQSLRDALAYSNNLVTIRLLEAIGIASVQDITGRLGVKSQLEYNLSLALGTSETSLQELVYAYAALANHGQVPCPLAILKITGRGGNVVFEGTPNIYEGLSREVAYLITDMLKGAVDYGTAKNVRVYGFKDACAGKTGTTDDCNDAWFIGYTPEIAAGLWVGYDQPRSMGKTLTGGAVCAPIWAEFMCKVKRHISLTPFIMPETLIMQKIDPATGLLAADACPQKKMELFIPGTEPTTYCTEHGLTPVESLIQFLAPTGESQPKVHNP